MSASFRGFAVFRCEGCNDTISALELPPANERMCVRCYKALNAPKRWRPVTSHGVSWEFLTVEDREEIRQDYAFVADVHLAGAKWKRVGERP